MSSAPAFERKILEQDAFKNAASQPVYLTKVEVHGGKNFTPHFFSKLLAPLIDRSDYTLQQLLTRVEQGQENLEKTNAFSAVTPSLHVDHFQKHPSITSYNKDKSILTKVVFDLDQDERSIGLVALGFNTEDNTLVNLGYFNNNFNRNAESVNIGVNYRPYKPSEHLLSGIRAESCLKNPAFKFIFDLKNSHDNNQHWQQNSSKETAGLIGVQYLNQQSNFSVFSGVSLARRSTYDIEEDSLADSEGFGGDFLKSSMISAISYRNLTSIGDSFPTGGVSLSLKNEISSDQLQDDSETTADSSLFLKLSGLFNAYKTLFKNSVTAHLFGELGHIHTHDADDLHLSDRFYLGGFDTFKGFARNSVRTSGGTQYYKAGATFYTRVPSFKSQVDEVNPLRLYGTGMVGGVGNGGSDSNNVASVGLGLRYFNKWVHFDAGYYMSQRMDTNDFQGVRDGFQLELSLGGVSRTT